MSDLEVWLKGRLTNARALAAGGKGHWQARVKAYEEVLEALAERGVPIQIRPEEKKALQAKASRRDMTEVEYLRWSGVLIDDDVPLEAYGIRSSVPSEPFGYSADA